MFCKYCGHELPNDARFCSKCGKVCTTLQDVMPEQEIVGTAPAPQPENMFGAQTNVVIDEKEKSSMEKKSLVLSIIGLILGASWFMSPIGLILSALAKRTLNKCKANFGTLGGKARAAKILSLVGLILSIICTVALVMVVINFIFMMLGIPLVIHFQIN